MTVIKEFPVHNSEARPYVLQFGKPGKAWHSYTYHRHLWYALLLARMYALFDSEGDSWRVVEQ